MRCHRLLRVRLRHFADIYSHQTAAAAVLPGVRGSLNGLRLALSVQGDGTITLLEKNVSMAFCARSSSSEL